jgi:PAS domain-containing protein
MKQVAEAFAHHKELFKSAVDHLPVGVFYKDADDDFRFITWKQSNADITSIAASDALGKTDFELFPAEVAEKFRADDI